jgi:hypothetical protein
MDLISRPRRLLALGTITLIALTHSSPAPVAAQATATLVVSEVHPTGSSNPAYGADWFEITNTGTVAADISGWKVDDSSNAFGSALALRGVTLIPPGRSAIFFEGLADGSTDATGGSGVGLSSGGDAVNVFDSAGVHVSCVTFGAATVGVTFDNAAGFDGAISALSAAGVNGAFTSPTGETGSPGRIETISTIDLSTYVRVGRFPLPAPPTVTPPPGSLLAQEASAVTYNWDTDTLFIPATVACRSSRSARPES